MMTQQMYVVRASDMKVQTTDKQIYDNSSKGFSMPTLYMYVVRASDMQAPTTDKKLYSMNKWIGKKIPVQQVTRGVPRYYYQPQGYSSKVILPDFMLSRTLGGSPLGKDPNTAGNIGGINDITTLTFSDYFYQPVNWEKVTMQNANLLTKWNEMIDFCTAVIKGVIGFVPKRILLGDFWNGNINAPKYYYNVTLTITPVRGVGGKVQYFNFRLSNYLNSMERKGYVEPDAQAQKVGRSLAWVQRTYMDNLFMKLRIGEKEKDADLVVNHTLLENQITPDKQEGETEAERIARIRREAQAEIARKNAEAQARANEAQQAKALASDIQAMVGEEARQEEEYRENVKKEIQRQRELEEEQRKLIELNKRIDEQRAEAYRNEIKRQQDALVRKKAQEEQQKAIAQARAEVEANKAELLAMLGRPAPKTTKVDIQMTETGLAELSKDKDDFGLMNTVTEWQDQPTGQGTTPSEEMAEIQAGWEAESEILNDDPLPLMQGKSPTTDTTLTSESVDSDGKSSKTLWIVLAVVGVLLLAGGGGYWYYQKKKKGKAGKPSTSKTGDGKPKPDLVKPEIKPKPEAK